MAEMQLIESQLRLTYESGVGENGKTLYRYKNYSNIKTEATADGLLQAAQVIASLQTYPLAKIERVDTQQINA